MAFNTIKKLAKNCILPLLLLAAMAGCHNDDSPTDPISQLPPATQSGAITFGCLINGKPFVHNEGPINCFYQYVDDGYYFGIKGKNRDENPMSVGIGAINKSFSEGENLFLVANEEGNALGTVFFTTSPTHGEGATTTNDYTGEATITKFDFSTHIVSGTFWFNVQHPVTGEIVEIREGRFDTYFTQ